MKLRYIAEAGKRGRKPIYTPRTEEFAKELGIHPKTLKEYFKLGCPQTSVEDIKKWRKENLSIPIYTPRTEEFAKELGIHPKTLREYFKLGCPQTSAEDIRKWREEYLKRPGAKQVYTPRIEEFAEELGVHPALLRRYFKLGCPQTSVEGIKKWREEYLRRPGAKQIHTPRIKEFAKELGVHPVLLRKYFKLGCPQASVEDIKKWREEYLRRPGKKKPGRKPTPRIKELEMAKSRQHTTESKRDFRSRLESVLND